MFTWMRTIPSFRYFSSTRHFAKKLPGTSARSSDFVNPVSSVYGHEYNPVKGEIADNKPFKVRVEKYVEYVWCGCGLSHAQPFCNGICKDKYWKKIYRNQGGPVTYIAPETKDVWFCNCKQTDTRPFCDGTHRRTDIQEMRIDGKQELFEPREVK